MRAKEVGVRGIFERIATRYDRMNDIISYGRHRAWKKYAVGEAVALRPGSVLDICCGTGDLALGIAMALPEARVTGLDFSPAMLEMARERGRGAVNLTLMEGDAQNLPFAPGSFDLIVISFGLRNLPDPRGALEGIFKALRPGGSLIVLDSSRPCGFFSRAAFFIQFKLVLPLVSMGRRREYAWLRESTAGFYTPEELKALMEAAGFHGVGFKSFAFGLSALHRGIKPEQ